MSLLSRQDFNAILKKYNKIGKGKVRLTQSTLQLIQPFDASKTVYNFNVLNTEPPVLPDEIRLNINDEFVITHAGVYIVANYFDAVLPTPNQTMKLLTSTPFDLFGNAVVPVENLYRGFKRISVNNVNYVDRWDTRKHSYKGVTQYQASSAGQPFATEPNADMDNSGMVGVTPMVTLSGAKKNEIQIALPNAIIPPANIAFITPNNSPITIQLFGIAIVYRGFLAQNAAKFQS